jgi:hypothetical protein
VLLDTPSCFAAWLIVYVFVPIGAVIEVRIEFSAYNYALCGECFRFHDYGLRRFAKLFFPS